MKKEIVFDSSTAILLAKIHLLNVVCEESKVIFSETVKEETTKKKDIFDSKLIFNLISENKINVIKAIQSEVSGLMEDFNIEKGEAEAIEIARGKKYLLAIDDGPSIKICKIMDIKFMTALHFLINFYKKGFLDKNIALEKLKDLERFGRYDYNIIKNARSKIEGE